MLNIAVTLAVVGVVFGAQGTFPHGHDLHQVVADGFNLFDTNHDGFLTQTEFDTYIAAEDANGDGMVSLAEYMAYFKFPLEIAGPIFSVFLQEGETEMSVSHMSQGVAVMDSDGDGRVSLKEYTHYQTGFLQCVFSEHGGHGHGHDCTQWHH